MQVESDKQEEEAPRKGGAHGRRPPLAEIDSWELWQEWRRGDRAMAAPWIALLASFCLVLAGMYSFFFFSTSLENDTTAMVVLTLVFLAFLFWLWRRISPRRGFALTAVLLMVLVSGAAFGLWWLAYRASGWSPWVAIAGTVVLGLGGVVTGLPALNAIARRQEDR
jgi:hypothetical protein